MILAWGQQAGGPPSHANLADWPHHETALNSWSPVASESSGETAAAAFRRVGDGPQKHLHSDSMVWWDALSHHCGTAWPAMTEPAWHSSWNHQAINSWAKIATVTVLNNDCLLIYSQSHVYM